MKTVVYIIFNSSQCLSTIFSPISQPIIICFCHLKCSELKDELYILLSVHKTKHTYVTKDSLTHLFLYFRPVLELKHNHIVHLFHLN